MSTCFSCEKPYDECRCGEPAPRAAPCPTCGELPPGVKCCTHYLCPLAQPAEPLPAITRKELRAERDAARADVERLKDEVEDACEKLNRIARQRDRYRKALERIRDEYDDDMVYGLAREALEKK